MNFRSAFVSLSCIIDDFILHTMKKLPSKFPIAHLVGEVMGTSGLALGDMQIFTRVAKFIERGDLILAEEWDSESPMRTVVKKKR